MGKLLTMIIGWAMSNFLAKVLTSAGLAILGTLTFSQFINYFLSKAINSLNEVPMLGLLGVVGFDKAISIIITAYMIRVYLSTVIQSVKIVKK